VKAKALKTAEIIIKIFSLVNKINLPFKKDPYNLFKAQIMA
jgi:hypothetical protein